MKKYIKKPVVIEAKELEYSTKSQEEIIEWSKGLIKKGLDGGLRIPTLEGVMVANTGDFIIKGVEGEFYPCKPNIFIKHIARSNKKIMKYGRKIKTILSSNGKNLHLGTRVSTFVRKWSIRCIICN